MGAAADGGNNAGAGSSAGDSHGSSMYSDEDLVRLMTQALYSMGYRNAAQTLEADANVLVQPPSVTQFRDSILDGDWGVAETLLPALQISKEVDLNSVKFLILEQKFLEHIEKGNSKDALTILREHLAKMGQDSQHIFQLSSYMMCTDAGDLQRRANWQGGSAATRIQLLKKLQKYISPALMIPENRMRTLIDQAFEQQLQSCVYHNVAEEKFSLFADHACTRNQIPREAKSILEAHTDEVWHVQFSHSGKFLATASKDKTAIIWDISQPEPVQMCQLVGHDDALSFLAWSPNDTMLLTCSNDNKVFLWDVESGNVLKRYVKHSDNVTACAWFPDNNTFVSGGLDKNIILWSVDGRELYTWSCSRINDLAVSANGKTMVAINSDKKIIVYDLSSSNRPDPVEIPETDSITSLCLSECGNHFLVNISSQEIHVWDLKDKKCLQKYKGQKQGRFVIRSAFGGRDQAFIVSGSEDSQVYIWHRQTGALLEVLSGHIKTVNAVAWNPKDPHMFASASDDGTVRIWGCADERNTDKDSKKVRKVLRAWEEA